MMNPGVEQSPAPSSAWASRSRGGCIFKLGRDTLQLPVASSGNTAPQMLFEFEKYSAKTAAKQMSQQRLEDRQRDVYESHRHRVFSVSYYMTGSEIEAEGLLQDTFISAFGRAPEPDQATVDASMLEQMRDQGLLDETETLPIPAVVHLPGSRNILRADLEEAIRCLPPRERLVFLLMDVEGYAPDRIAALLEMEPSEVVRTAVRARMRLRAEIAAVRENGQCAA